MKLSFLSKFQMSSYAEEYSCAGDEATHVCHDCPETAEQEFARVRASGWIKEAYLPTLLADPTDVALWNTGVTAGSVIVLPKTSGSYDPGKPKELKGFGERRVTYGPRTMKVMVNDPDYVDNYHFYNEISLRNDLVPFFLTSSQVRIFDKPASITAADPVADDLEEQVIWNVESEVISKNLPIMVPRSTIESVFTCPNA